MGAGTAGMSLTRVSACAAAAFVCLASRAPAQAPLIPRDTVTREYRGSYQAGFEQSWFVPFDAPPDDKLWWGTLTDHATAERDSLLATIPQPPTEGLTVRRPVKGGPRIPACPI